MRFDIIRDVAIRQFTTCQVVEISTLAEGRFLIIILVHARLLPFEVYHAFICGGCGLGLDIFKNAFEMLLGGVFPRENVIYRLRHLGRTWDFETKLNCKRVAYVNRLLTEVITHEGGCMTERSDARWRGLIRPSWQFPRQDKHLAEPQGFPHVPFSFIYPFRP